MSSSYILLNDPGHRRTFFRLQVIRSVILVLAALFISQTLDLGISSVWILLAVVAGVAFSGRALSSCRVFIDVAMQHVFVFLLLAVFFWAANLAVTSPESLAKYTDFIIPRFADDVFLILSFYVAAAASTWFFWTRSYAVTLEGALYSVIFVWLLSGHRNYHIDSPKEISALSWKLEILQKLQVEPQHVFVGVGAAFVLFLLAYFVFSANRPIFGRNPSVTDYGKVQKTAGILCPLLLLGLLYYYAQYINQNYSTDLSRVSNGVGDASKASEGESNLGFHSAIAPTKQASALVRMEGDYSDNPWTPMLYLREGALSSFNGRELVKAGPQFDTDVPNVGLGQPFIAPSGEPGENRERVVQSVYLLTPHSASFALDIPRRLQQIKNPVPGALSIGLSSPVLCA